MTSTAAHPLRSRPPRSSRIAVVVGAATLSTLGAACSSVADLPSGSGPSCEEIAITYSVSMTRELVLTPADAPALRVQACADGICASYRPVEARATADAGAAETIFLLVDADAPEDGGAPLEADSYPRRRVTCASGARCTLELTWLEPARYDGADYVRRYSLRVTDDGGAQRLEAGGEVPFVGGECGSRPAAPPPSWMDPIAI